MNWRHGIFLWSVDELVLDERHYSVETCTSWDNVWISSGDIDWLRMDRRFLHGDVYGKFRQSTTTRFIIVIGLWCERSLKGGQLNEFWWLSHLGNFPEVEEYFQGHRHWFWEAGRYSGTRNIFWNRYKFSNIECEDVNELVNDQCLLAYTASSTSLTLKVWRSSYWTWTLVCLWNWMNDMSKGGVKVCHP